MLQSFVLGVFFIVIWQLVRVFLDLSVCVEVGGGVLAVFTVVVDTLCSSQEFSQENINSCRNKITVKNILI